MDSKRLTSINFGNSAKIDLYAKTTFAKGSMHMKKKVLFFFMITTGLLGYEHALADPAQDEAIRKGQEHFKIFCSNCHGDDADGNGRLVASLKITASDLTSLKQTGGDMCVAERVLRSVAGMHHVPAGQEQKMPNFSANLESITTYEITQYLKSIQK